MRVWSIHFWQVIIVLAILMASVLGVFVLSPNTTSAQISENDFYFNFTPKVPGANEETTVEINSLVVNLERLLITWIVDGEVRVSGVGERTLVFTTGESGSQTTVDVFIQLTSDDVFRRRVVVSPATITLLWETTQSYTPPFYRGKALPAPEEFIKVVGLPTIENETVETLERAMVFNWEHNGKNLPDQSGYGDNPLYIRNDVLRDLERVQLTALHRNGRSQAQTTIFIPITQPRIVLYHETEGTPRAVSGTTRISGVQTLRAEPFFFSVSRRTLNLLDYVWSVNERVIQNTTSSQANELVVAGGEQTGLSQINLTIEHPLKILQAAQSGPLLISFGQQQ